MTSLTVVLGANGGRLDFNRISWIYLCYMLESFSGPRNSKVPKPIKDFFTSLYVVGGERAAHLFRGTHKLIDNTDQVLITGFPERSILVKRPVLRHRAPWRFRFSTIPASRWQFRVRFSRGLWERPSVSWSVRIAFGRQAEI